jgi:hypothetical protein
LQLKIVILLSVDNRPTIECHGDGNGVVEQADYDLWKTHFGESIAIGSEAVDVPEPTTLLLTLPAFAAAPLRVQCG